MLHGASASPYDALNGLRGIRTLAVRQRHQADVALRVAAALRDHPGVAAVHYPGLPDHPQHELAARQLTCLPTVLAVDLAGGVDAARAMLDAPARRPLGDVARRPRDAGVPLRPPAPTSACRPTTRRRSASRPGCVRISVGLEDADDLVADLERAIPT